MSSPRVSGPRIEPGTYRKAGALTNKLRHTPSHELRHTPTVKLFLHVLIMGKCKVKVSAHFYSYHTTFPLRTTINLTINNLHAVILAPFFNLFLSIENLPLYKEPT